mmetsp:Transcript_104124/g.290082  ORF Transcript_104124/g.290082 Transcript_104124/m.290082 type:complete len:360 (-) Transcript_104124:5-1084(-)
MPMRHALDPEAAHVLAGPPACRDHRAISDRRRTPAVHPVLIATDPRTPAHGEGLALVLRVVRCGRRCDEVRPGWVEPWHHQVPRGDVNGGEHDRQVALQPLVLIDREGELASGQPVRIVIKGAQDDVVWLALRSPGVPHPAADGAANGKGGQGPGCRSRRAHEGLEGMRGAVLRRVPVSPVDVQKLLECKPQFPTLGLEAVHAQNRPPSTGSVIQYEAPHQRRTPVCSSLLEVLHRVVAAEVIVLLEVRFAAHRLKQVKSSVDGEQDHALPGSRNSRTHARSNYRRDKHVGLFVHDTQNVGSHVHLTLADLEAHSKVDHHVLRCGLHGTLHTQPKSITALPMNHSTHLHQIPGNARRTR